MNRAGKSLKRQRRKILMQAKVELLALFEKD